MNYYEDSKEELERIRYKEGGKIRCPKASDCGKSDIKDTCASYHSKNKDGKYDPHIYCFKDGETFKPPKEEEEKTESFTPPPPPNYTGWDQWLIDYWNERGISQDTLVKSNIVSQSTHYFHKAKRELPCCEFVYRDSNGNHINSKYRLCFTSKQKEEHPGCKKLDKELSQHKGGQKVLLGLDALIDQMNIIITEGEPDYLSWIEAGVLDEGYAVTSPPSGAGAVNEAERKQFEETGQINVSSPLNLDYLDASYNIIEGAEMFFIATDNDAAGTKLRLELVRRLGADRCRIVDLHDCKDANEYLLKYGSIALLKTLEDAKEPPIENMVQLSDDWDDMIYYYRNGMPSGLDAGIDNLRGHFSFRLGELTLILGIPGMGKTMFAFFLAIQSALLHGFKWAIYSPENEPRSLIWTQLIEIYMGKTSDVKYSIRMTEEEFQRGSEWVDKHFVLLDSEDLFTPDSMLEKFEEFVKRRGINAVLCDPFNDLVHTRKGEDKDEYLLRVLSHIRRFKKKYNVAFFINIHPVVIREKQEGTSKPIVPTAYHASGGAAWNNRADNILTVYRDFEESDVNKVEIYVQKIKFQRLVGVPTVPNNPVVLYFNIKNKHYESHPDLSSTTQNKIPESSDEMTEVQQDIQGYTSLKSLDAQNVDYDDHDNPPF